MIICSNIQILNSVLKKDFCYSLGFFNFALIIKINKIRPLLVILIS